MKQKYVKQLLIFSSISLLFFASCSGGDKEEDDSSSPYIAIPEITLRDSSSGQSSLASGQNQSSLTTSGSSSSNLSPDNAASHPPAKSKKEYIEEVYNKKNDQGSYGVQIGAFFSSFDALTKAVYKTLNGFAAYLKDNQGVMNLDKNQKLSYNYDPATQQLNMKVYQTEATPIYVMKARWEGDKNNGKVFVYSTYRPDRDPNFPSNLNPVADKSFTMALKAVKKDSEVKFSFVQKNDQDEVSTVKFEVGTDKISFTQIVKDLKLYGELSINNPKTTVCSAISGTTTCSSSDNPNSTAVPAGFTDPKNLSDAPIPSESNFLNTYETY